MTNDYLQKSNIGVRTHIILTAFFALIFGIFGAWAFSRLFGWTPSQGRVASTIAWILLAGGWAIASVFMWLDWKSRSYHVGENGITVNDGIGRFGASKEIFRYESIISLRSTQGFWGKRFNYGDIRIAIPKLDKEVVLKGILNPSDVLSKIQSQINERGANTHALIN